MVQLEGYVWQGRDAQVATEITQCLHCARTRPGHVARPFGSSAAGAAVEVHDEVEPLPAQARGEPQVVAEPRQAARPRQDDDLVQVRMVANDGLGRPFHEIGDASRRKPAAHGADRGCGEDHVADQAQPDQEDLQGSTVASSISMTGMSSLIG